MPLLLVVVTRPSAELAGENLTISVSDDGPGFKSDAKRQHTGDGGYGLHNIRQRLLGHFGDRAGLEVGRVCDRTVARLALPVESLERVRKRGGPRLGSGSQGAA